MKKTILKILLCLFAIATVAFDNAVHGQDKNGMTRSIIINNGDTIVNGKKFKDLNKVEQAKLREEFKEMEKNFRGGSNVRSKENVVIRRGDDNEDFVISRNGKEPKILIWNDDIGPEVRNFNFNGKIPDELRVLRDNGDSIFFDKDFQVFNFGGDSSMNFRFNADSLLQRFNFKMDGLDSSFRKRIITMHRDKVPGFPGTFERVELPGMRLEGRPFAGFAERNNSASFNYNYTDNDGISSHMNIRISDAGKDQLKKITGTEAITKSLIINDLTLFPNFSSGKMTLSFNVASKGTAKVNVLDSDLKSIFTDDIVNLYGNYVKQLTLPKNGVYYVTVNQNGNWFVKRLVKE